MDSEKAYGKPEVRMPDCESEKTHYVRVCGENKHQA